MKKPLRGKEPNAAPPPRIIVATPIVRGIPLSELTYFTSQDIPEGSIISAPVRGRETRMLVLKNTDARMEKMLIKKAHFSLKKTHLDHPRLLLRPEIIRAAERAAAHEYIPLGAYLSRLIPAAILSHHPGYSSAPRTDAPLSKKRLTPLVFQADDHTRLAAYKTIIRDSWARGTSVAVCIPGAHDAQEIFFELSKGIEKRSFLIHSRLLQKKLLATWMNAEEAKTPILAVGTPSVLALMRNDWGTIIVEREGSRAWKTNLSPHADLRRFAEECSAEIGAQCIFGDFLLSTETRFKKESGEYGALTSLSSRLHSPAHTNIADMKKEREETGEAFSAISARLSRLIEKNVHEKELLFIFTPRKGIAGITVCGDCGAIVRCPRCEKPLRLRRGTNGNEFACGECARKEAARDSCETCGSWRMTPLGAGSDRAVSEIRRRYPALPVFQIDAHATKTDARAKREMKTFTATPGSVLVGTEMALAYLPHAIRNIATVNIDPLLLTPDFRARERAWRILAFLRSAARARFLVQTHAPDDPFFSTLTAGNADAFFKQEIADRKLFSYPPFSMIVKISYPPHMEAKVVEVMATFSTYSPTRYILKNKKKGGVIILKVPVSVQNEPSFVVSLGALPPRFYAEINPDSLFS